ncbi:serine/threonine-protein kinase [Rhizobacter sp. SG703]|uniref:serine/threonine-protein kinase n=1 Tax=Rhizobacter sp. SG703 TaxID=2587140 RepID=UPI0014482E46|nr:serine/threonine-protein kinase [Rhizobacter sp. SG703]NKI94832.1 tetratricopeptide (TPR) repeat protein/tRNA A-37 threonylcarbamoyl transferase component Bud32 [Rhizobacter sp. SG703]
MSLATDAQRWQRLKALVADALALDATQRTEFVQRSCAGEPDLQAELESLLAAAAPDDTPLDQQPAAQLLQAIDEHASRHWIGRRLGPYRLVSLIARGGMGEVYRGERDDGQFEQRVAIKLMRADGDQQMLLARFNAERRILASLDHPNLAKLLDAGLTPDGEPYFVMELVDGIALDFHCEQQALPVAQRLQLFRSVCLVVDYAHRQGVIHRDLKPANILVTPQGVVKLVDFGIAKRVGPLDGTEGSEPTLTLQRVLTPDYASPEQVRGEPLTPASDIYALGVVLYRLLARASPYGAATDSYALTRAICETEPPRPSRAVPHGGRLRRQLRGDLDAMVLMALRKEPAHRYASAEALADDVFRHLEGLPVHARRGAWSYRAGRFVLRHRAMVGTALVANLALSAGIGIAAYEAWEANVQRERAERHFASVRKLTNTLILDVNNAIRDLPGSTQARQLVVQTALNYLQQLSAELQGDAALQLELAGGYRQIADLQGRNSEASLGDPVAALASYERGLALAEPLGQPARRRDPNFRAAQRELALLHGSRGALLTSMGRNDAGMESLRQGIAITDDLIAAEPDNAPLLRLRATLYSELAHGQQNAGQHEAFLASTEAATQQLEALLARQPGDAIAANTLATTYGLRGMTLLGHDLKPDTAQRALQAYGKGAALLQRLADANPNDTKLMRTLAIQYHGMGRSLVRLKQPAKALELHRRAIAMLERLAQQEPNSPQFNADRAGAAVRLSEAQLAAGDVPGSRSTAAAAVATFEALPDGIRRDIVTHYLHGLAYYQLAQALRAQGDHDEACRRYRQSLPLFDDVARLLDPTDIGPDAARAALQRCT